MTTHIQSLLVWVRQATPAQAVVAVRVSLNRRVFLSYDEVRGKLVGPRCDGRSTVEVAFPLREVAPINGRELTLEAVIPEPNVWTTEEPFRYDGILEVWSNGERKDTRTFSVELKRSDPCDPPTSS